MYQIWWANKSHWIINKGKRNQLKWRRWKKWFWKFQRFKRKREEEEGEIKDSKSKPIINKEEKKLNKKLKQRSKKSS